MPITKTGRYSMNPAYAEALDAAMAKGDGADQQGDGADGQDGAQDGCDGGADGAKADGAAGKSNKSDGRKDGEGKGAVRRIEIEPAENGGYVSRTHREQSEDGDGGEPDGWAPPYQEPELRAHPDRGHLLKFLEQELEK
jgi:hypothetical protein